MTDEEQKFTEEKTDEDLISLGEVQKESELPLQEIRIDSIEGLMKPTSTVPTKVPRYFIEQEVHYKSGTVYRLYKYISDAWQKIFDSAVQPKTFVELAPLVVSKSQTSIDVWEDWDLSASIPANAHAVEISVYVANTETGGVRKNGSATERISSSSLPGYMTFTTLLDSNRIIETYHSTTNLRFYVTGYWI
jgi:hypothetical protein